MMTSSHRFVLSALLSLSVAPVFTSSLLTARAQPPEVAVRAEEKPDEPETLPIVAWDELKKQIGGPTLITLHAKEMPIGEVIDALNQQSPVPVTMQNRSYLEQQKKPPLTADYEKQPFWTVARDIAEKASIGIQNYGGQNGISFTPWGSENVGLLSNTEAALFNLTSASYSRYVSQAEKETGRSESLYLNCTLFADPKLQWQSQGIAVHLSEALDDKNQSLLPAEDSDIYNQGIPLEMNLQLKSVDSKSGTLKSLRGTFHGAVAFVSEKWEVPDVLKAQNVEKVIEQDNSRTRLELQDVVRDDEGYRVTLIISQSGPNAQQRARLSTGKQIWMQNNFYNQIRLLDAQGRALQMRRSDSKQDGDEETRITTYTATYVPNRDGDEDNRTGEPTTLVIRYDADWRELIIPFAFKNVKLP